MANSYPLGSVWKRRDKKLAVIVSDTGPEGWCSAIEADHDNASPYYIDTKTTGRDVAAAGEDSCRDLMYRHDGVEVGDLLDAADKVVNAWVRGDLAKAVRGLVLSVEAARDAA